MDIFDNKPDRGFFQWSGQSSLARHRNGTFNCDNCGVAIHRRPSQITGKTIACSRSCAGMLRRVRVKSNCTICGKEIELTPSKVVQVVTCSQACHSLRLSCDNLSRAPRLEQTKETREQFCIRNGLTRSQFRYRSAKGIRLDAHIVQSISIRDAESGREWPSLAACARELGYTGTGLSYRISKGLRCNGLLLIKAGK